MEQEFKELIIGAFLHDIGKISQRAKVKLSPQSEGMKSQACPTNEFGGYGYSHVPYTNQFFEDVKDWLPQGGMYWANAANCATYHHKPQPDNLLDLIVHEGDCLSAGHDRNDGEAKLSENQYRLDSIFSKIKLGDNKAIIQKFQYKIAKSMLNADAYPADGLPENPDSELVTLYNDMCAHIKRLKDSSKLDFDVFIEHLKWVYSQYAWCIPSSLRQASDVSLLDHSLTTTAISAVLYRYHQQAGSFNSKDIADRSKNKFRLVSGDVSGIQSYIFADSTESPKGVSKRLRAKSFYIGILTQIASMMILRELELPCFCKVLDAGGRFTLLVHNTDQTVKKLNSLQKLIDEWMYKTLDGKLRINLAFNTECSGSDFIGDNFGKVYAKLQNDTEKAKKRPFESIFTQDGKWNTDKMISNIQGEEIKDREEQHLKFFEKLGGVLPGQSHLVITDISVNNPGRLRDAGVVNMPMAQPFGKYSVELCDYNAGAGDDKVRARFGFVPGMEDFADIVDGQYIANYVPVITDEDLRHYKLSGFDKLPDDEGEDKQDFKIGSTKTFAHIAADSVGFDREFKPLGSPMLGVLKADVDRLGMIFGSGIEERKSIARIATLSRGLDMFFKGVLPNSIKNGDGNSSYKNIYTIYAGGDDLLLVGPWNVIMNFAMYMQGKFTQYTCNNPSITISAGIAAVKAGFPLSEAARLAEEALEQSKDGGRNKITVFDQTLSWEDYKEALENGAFLDGHLENSSNPLQGSLEISASFAYRLIKYARMGLRVIDAKKDGKNDKKINLADVKWKSQLAYDIGRNIKTERNKNSNQLDELIRIVSPENEKIGKLLVAATYCNYRNRRK